MVAVVGERLMGGLGGAGGLLLDVFIRSGGGQMSPVLRGTERGRERGFCLVPQQRLVSHIT